MSATGTRIKLIPAKGIDQRWKSELGSAEDISCARIDPNGLGWLFDRGLEPWWDPAASVSIVGTASTIASYIGSEIVSCFVWSKQNTEQVYYLIEQAGNLYYFWGNKGIKTGDYYFNDIEVIDTNRHIPSANEPGTQYIPFGNKLLIVNGYDKPILFYGRNRARDFSFNFQTPPPETLQIQSGYLKGDALLTGIASPTFGDDNHYGLGQFGERNHFTWKISFVTDTGSESPLSPLTVVDWYPGIEPEENVKFGVFLTDLPTGPDGTVARRIYRTKNQKLSTSDGASDAIYYFLKQIDENVSTSFVDVMPDGNLVDRAPSQTDSSVVSGAYQYGANWNNRIWLGGGAPHPTRIVYSQPGFPEQFGALDYFELGNTAGGAITQLFPYYNNLLVFRQRSIDMVRITARGYFISQVTPEIGTEASNTIKLVPGVGVCFLTGDGVYAVNGGTEGGSKVSVDKISGKLGKEIERINRSAIHKAVAVYSGKEREYWIHYPVDGQKYNTRGMVLHTNTGDWSLRHSLGTNDALFRFSSMTVDPDGNIIIGPNPDWSLAPTAISSTAELPGVLHVWCGSTRWGAKWTTTSFSEDVAAYSIADNAKPANRWESSWIDFNNGSNKNRVFSVEVEILSQGNTNIELSWAQDYDYKFSSSGVQKQNRPETVKTTLEDPVFGPDNGDSKHYFRTGTDALQDGRITTLRWDVNTKLVQNFKFRLDDDSASQPFHVVSFNIDWDSRDQKPLNQNARSTPGQPR
jgi:hypothetical protein